MKILQIAHSLPFMNQAGTEVYAYNLSLELAKRHRVYLFARNCDIKQKEYEVTRKELGGITAYLINNTFRYCDSFEMYYENEAIDKRFAELLNEIKPDIVHIQHLIFLSIGLIKIISERGIPVVFTLHDYWLICPRWHLLKKDLNPCDKAVSGKFDRECLDCLKELLNIKKNAKRIYVFASGLLPGPLIEYLKKIYFLSSKISDNGNGITRLKERNYKIKDLLKKIEAFLVPSAHLRDRFIEFDIPAEKIKLSKNHLNTGSFIHSEKSKSGKVRFAFIGTILPAKGLHILIDSFNGIGADTAELKIYGKLYSYTGFEYYLPHLKRLIKNKNIRFMGEFDHGQVADIFKEIDVLVVPSIWHENSPLVIREAFLSKTPVLASNIGGIPELIIDGVNGLLFNPRDANDLRRQIQHITSNPDILEKFKKNMPQEDAQGNIKEIEDLYNSLLRKH